MESIKHRLMGLGMTSSTINTYLSILDRFFKHSGKVNNFTQQEISNYLDYLIVTRNYKARSRNLVMKVIKFYCREFLNYDLKLQKSKEDKPIPKICWNNEFQEIISVTKNMNKIIATKNKCKCGTNFILTIAGWKCPKCDIPKRRDTNVKKK